MNRWFPIFFNPIVTDKEDEIFLPIIDEIVSNVKPWYFISNYSNIYSINSNKLSKRTITTTDGYYRCTLRTYNDKGITVLPHRIAMLTFKYEPGCELLFVDHVDCDKLNCDIRNLEWVTLAENTRRAAKNGLMLSGERASWTKVMDVDVHRICQLWVSGMPLTEIVNAVKCGMDSAFRIVHGISRIDIASQYDMECRYRGILSDADIDYICSLYEKFNHIGNYMSMKQAIIRYLPFKITNDIDKIMRNLYRHDPYCYYRISSKYNYTPDYNYMYH